MKSASVPLQVVALLLELSVDLESAPDGLTPLCLASEAGHLEVRARGVVGRFHHLCLSQVSPSQRLRRDIVQIEESTVPRKYEVTVLDSFGIFLILIMII